MTERKRTNNDLQKIHIKIKDRVTRTSPKTGGERRCSGRVRSSCSISGTRRVDLVTKPVIGHEWCKNREVLTSGPYRGYLWHRYSITANQVMVATVKPTKWWLQINKEEFHYAEKILSVLNTWDISNQDLKYKNEWNIIKHLLQVMTIWTSKLYFRQLLLS